MKDIIISGAKLFLICAVAATALAAINAITEPVIAQRKIVELKNALKELSPDAEPGNAVEIMNNPVISCGYPLTRGNQKQGMILILIGEGYGGDMKILARFDSKGVIKTVKLMDNLETPGLGKKAESESYMKKYIGKGNAGNPIPVSKKMLKAGEADAITGATITFIGIAKALAEGSRYVREDSSQ